MGSVSDLGAQEACPWGRIAQIEIRSLDPYDEDATAPEATFDWAFRALNWLHLETRERVIRWELLFSEGECYDPLRLSESERNLRSLRFIQSASITSESLEDGSRRIEVVTRDNWAISASVGVDLEGGVNLTGVQAGYGNVLGYGLRAQLFRRSFRERLRRGVLARHVNLFGSGVDALAHGGETLAGDYFSQSLTMPFRNEFGAYAFRQAYARRDDFFGYSLPPHMGFTPAFLRYRAELLDLSFQARLGPRTGRVAVVGLGLSRESFDTPFGVEGVRAVVDGDYDGSVPAGDTVRAVVELQAAPYGVGRVTAYLGMRKVRFETRGGLDGIRALQDLMVGQDVILSAGPGFAVDGTDHRDVLLRLQSRIGYIGPSYYGMTRLDVHGRRALRPSPGPGGWRDLVGVVRTDFYWTHNDWSSLYLRGRVSGGWNTDRPFQLTLGGRDGVRAYDEDAFPGGRLLFLSAEQRFDLERFSPGFADLGAAAFVDGGRMWGGDAPFGEPSGWQSGVGIGLRGSAEGARRVMRMDLTLPLGDQRSARGVVFRVYGELFGVLDRRRWPSQIERSRWYGSDPDLSRRVPDPLAGN